MAKELIYVLALVTGMLITIQAGVNARLGQELGNKMHAVLASFTIGTIGVWAYCLLARDSVTPWAQMKAFPWWVWVGGGLGLVFVWSTIYCVPKIGVSIMFPLVVSGQMIASLVIDHYGLMGAQVQRISLTKLGAAALMMTGVILLAITKETAPRGD